MGWVNRLKTKHFPKGIRRSLDKYRNRLFKRTTEARLEKALASLGMPDNAVICVHSMLSGMGHIVGGPETVIQAIRKAVPDSTLMMPTFPFDGTAESYLSDKPVYHRDETPSFSGLLTETLRRFSGAKRSYHPTHPCAALGPKAAELIDGTESSQTPFGDASTYGRFSEMEDAYLLLIHTNNTSIVHRIQEMVNMPNLFYNRLFDAQGYDAEGRLETYPVRVHLPKIPLFLVMPGDSASPEDVEYIWYPDYVLLFPQYNRERILNRLKSHSARKILIDRHESFMERQVYRVARIHDAEIMAVKVKPWLEALCADIEQSLSQFSELYALAHMNQMLESGRLSK